MNNALTFIIDCPYCKTKVAANQQGEAKQEGFDEEADYPFCRRLLVGSCPRCSCLLVGETSQVAFEKFDAEEDAWSDVVRVYPKPPRAFSSSRVPRVVKDSLDQAERSLQAKAHTAACAMLGRALEAVCRDVLGSAAVTSSPKASSPKPVMLARGIQQLKDKGIIDNRLFDWSQQLHAFRNLAAHAEDVTISREDTEDLQSFACAIVEYVYDLSDRYQEFQSRIARRTRRLKPKPPSATPI